MKPWYKVITPREDLREGRPLDASEFAVHLDHVRDGRAPAVYQDPAQFFERTFLTKTLRDLSVQVVRRLNGIKVETSAIFNLSTQFGGGKTHALTLLYHLASGAEKASAWKGVPFILQDAGVTAVPGAATAIFVGTEFDSVTGRGGGDGTPLRKTPWGEVAFQLGGADAFALIEEHEKTQTAPGGDVIERLLPQGKPTLILFDELMNYVSRTRRGAPSGQLYHFLQNLCEVARGRDNVVVAVSIPASELEMTSDDLADFERFKKLLDRLGKAMVMSAETETSEIIRRRLFEWGGLPKDALETLDEYATWLRDNKHQLPNWFPVDSARKALEATYPFHPSLISVFERKWQSLPRFQQTRGVLRLLALWVSKVYSDGYKGAHKDALISAGTAPLDDPTFRAAVFEQLGEQRLEPAVTTDIAGSDGAHAVRLDAEATPEVKKARLHRKVATAIFLESNGGQHRGEATLPEVRLAVAEPGLDVGNVEQCVESLVDACYFLSGERNRYRFSFQPNLNKLLSDRRASVPTAAAEERVKTEVQKVFSAGIGVERIYYPQKSNQVPDRPALALVVLSPGQAAGEAATKRLITSIMAESGASSRTFKSAIIFSAVDDGAPLVDEARKLLAWKDIDDDADDLRLDETQRRLLSEHIKRAERDLREAVWRSYKHIFLLSEDGALRDIDLGLVHSSAAGSLVELVLSRLRQEDLVVPGVSPNLLARFWPPALPEWSTRAVRDAFYASPKLPRLLNPEAVRDTIAAGLNTGQFAYIGKAPDGSYEPFIYKQSVPAGEVEIRDDVFLITREKAEEYLAKKAFPSVSGVVSAVSETQAAFGSPSPSGSFETARPVAELGVTPSTTEMPVSERLAGFTWSGVIPPQKWVNFYMRILTKFVTGGGLKLSVTVDVSPATGVDKAQLDEIRTALRELGVDETLRLNQKP